MTTTRSMEMPSSPLISSSLVDTLEEKRSSQMTETPINLKCLNHSREDKHLAALHAFRASLTR